MTPEMIQAKVEELSRRYATASEKRSTLGGLLAAKKQELIALTQEIEKAGYNPKTLKETREKLQADLEERLKDFEGKLQEVEKALAAFEGEMK